MMRFFERSISGALGCLLAHTHRIQGRVIKKGKQLTEEDLASFAGSGIDSIMVAEIENLDVEENAAAGRLSSRFLGFGVEAGRASTGRCNLFSATDGLFRVNKSDIDRFNSIDEAITIATLPNHSRVTKGTMVGTVKIIPFSVPDETITKCENTLGESISAMEVSAFKRKQVGILLTEMPGTNERVLERASDSLRARVERLGSEVKLEVRCSHSIDEVSQALQKVCLEECDLVLMLGSSAITDRRDVLPQAVEAVGGAIEHFGMPVDPGNLLLLATKGDTQIVGVPGCARSLKPSGFDWVLERMMCEIAVSGAELMRMGVGGLLKEASNRPMPREGLLQDAEFSNAGVSIVILAAGSSRRMGPKNKLLQTVEGQPMIARVVDSALSSKAEHVAMILGHEAGLIKEALRGREVEFINNSKYLKGMGTSVAVGAKHFRNSADGLLICLGDMPWLESKHLNLLIDAFDLNDDKSIYVPEYQGKRGNPVLWHSRFFDELCSLQGDWGARKILEKYSDEICYVEIPTNAISMDLDTPDSFLNLIKPD